ncbi:MAG: hypothetical protein ACRYG8_13730 [Janthinobacterium lividum]
MRNEVSDCAEIVRRQQIEIIEDSRTKPAIVAADNAKFDPLKSRA